MRTILSLGFLGLVRSNVRSCDWYSDLNKWYPGGFSVSLFHGMWITLKWYDAYASRISYIDSSHEFSQCNLYVTRDSYSHPHLNDSWMSTALSTVGGNVHTFSELGYRKHLGLNFIPMFNFDNLHTLAMGSPAAVT